MLCNSFLTFLFSVKVRLLHLLPFSLRGVIFHVAARDGYEETALTVESCRCPTNYTGISCQKCAEGYGRPHPLVGIYLGQCWSCRSVCHERSDSCDRDTGNCFVSSQAVSLEFCSHSFHDASSNRTVK